MKIKDNYCISYHGIFKEFIAQLIYLRPSIEECLPGIKIYISCKNEIYESLKNKTQIIPEEFNNNEYAYLRKITFNNISHPILDLIDELDIHCHHQVKNRENNKCIVLTKSIAPFKNLSSSQIEICINKAKREGFMPEIDGNIENASWVIGGECEKLYVSAVSGIRTTLVPNGLGEKLFKIMFKNNEIFNC